MVFTVSTLSIYQDRYLFQEQIHTKNGKSGFPDFPFLLSGNIDTHQRLAQRKLGTLDINRLCPIGKTLLGACFCRLRSRLVDLVRPLSNLCKKCYLFRQDLCKPGMNRSNDILLALLVDRYNPRRKNRCERNMPRITNSKWKQNSSVMWIRMMRQPY